MGPVQTDHTLPHVTTFPVASKPDAEYTTMKYLVKLDYNLPAGSLASLPPRRLLRACGSHLGPPVPEPFAPTLGKQVTTVFQTILWFLFSGYNAKTYSMKKCGQTKGKKLKSPGNPHPEEPGAVR